MIIAASPNRPSAEQCLISVLDNREGLTQKIGLLLLTEGYTAHHLLSILPSGDWSICKLIFS